MINVMQGLTSFHLWFKFINNTDLAQFYQDTNINSENLTPNHHYRAASYES